MRNNGESDESFERKFAAEKSRQFDIFNFTSKGSHLVLSVDGCSEKASEFSMPGYQLKPSDGKQLNWSI